LVALGLSDESIWLAFARKRVDCEAERRELALGELSRSDNEAGDPFPGKPFGTAPGCSDSVSLFVDGSLRAGSPPRSLIRCILEPSRAR